jgi:hypothetical protein
MTQIEPRPVGAIQPAGTDWKTRWIAAGGVVGALLGVGAVYLYIRSVEAEQGSAAPGPRPVKPGAALQVALSILSTLRQFANLGLD